VIEEGSGTREEKTYRIAGILFRLQSEVGDPGAYLPPAMEGFASSGEPDLTLRLIDEEEALCDPLKRFFPPRFNLRREGEKLVFGGGTGQQSHLGYISVEDSLAELGLPRLDGPWRVEEEREAVGEALRSFLAACLQVLLLREGGTLLHAAGVSTGGEAYAFVGHTGSGKTTLAARFPPGEVLGDDLLAVRPLRGDFLLYGTPWPGREGGRVAYGGLPLVAVFTLHPWAPRDMQAVGAGEAVAELMLDAPRLEWPEEESELLDIFSSLVRRVPIYRLSVGLEDDIASFLREFRASRGKEG